MIPYFGSLLLPISDCINSLFWLVFTPYFGLYKFPILARFYSLFRPKNKEYPVVGYSLSYWADLAAYFPSTEAV